MGTKVINGNVKITNGLTLGDTTLDEATLNRLLALLPPVLPVKGDIIDFDAFGDGTQKRFRVLKVEENNIYTLMSMDKK